MGSEENKAIVRRFVEEIPNMGNVAAADALLADGFVLHFPNMPDLEGAEAFKDLPAAIRTAFPDLVETIEELIAEGSYVVERFSLRARIAETSWASPRRERPSRGRRLRSTALRGRGSRNAG
jgi:predicted SnoaL-like aldol condensation-catalyzing enzyme